MGTGQEALIIKKLDNLDITITVSGRLRFRIWLAATLISWASRLISDTPGITVHEVEDASLSAEDAISFNEGMINAHRFTAPKFGHCQPDVASKLILHPTLKCYYPHLERYNPVTGNVDRPPAVWRRDMTWPLCASCHVEEPYV